MAGPFSGPIWGQTNKPLTVSPVDCNGVRRWPDWPVCSVMVGDSPGWFGS